MPIRCSILILLLLCLASSAFAQDIVPYLAPSAAERFAKTSSSADSANGEGPPVRHVFHLLNSGPEARQALEIYHRLKDNPSTLSGKQALAYDVGDTTTFDVYNLEKKEWMEDIPFILKAESPALYLWVQQAELDSGYVRPQDIDALYSALQEETPPGSYNPNEGIIVNNNKLFGQPGDIDNNGRVHILLTDIKDGRDPDSDDPYVAGFIHFEDLNPTGPGNGGEVLYLDTRPGIYSQGEHRISLNVEATAAHEYQHLIHANYDINELSFVNEGLSEWAEIANGYPRRPANYLSHTNDSTGYNVALFLWRFGEDNVIYDYQRASLFTQYVAEQTGIMPTGSITRIQENGIAGYNDVLDSRSFEQFLLDFHTANIINNVSYDSSYGYVAPGRQGLRADPTYSYDGRVNQSVQAETLSVASGAAAYLVWNHVEDLTVTIDAQAPLSNLMDMRERLRVRVIARRPNGSISESTFKPRRKKTFEGTFERVTYIVAHVKPRERDATVTFESHWQSETVAYVRDTLAYDDGVPLMQDTTAEQPNPVLFTTGQKSEGMWATRFAVPSSGDAVLSKVSLAFYYLSQFTNGPPNDAPRDFTLHVWGQGPAGRPGEEIFSVTLDDPRPYQLGVPRDTYDRFTVDLADYQETLSNLPDTIFVGISEAGTDENYMVLAPAPYDDHNTSFIGKQTFTGASWTPLWDLELSNGTSLKHSTFPIRAIFLIPKERDTTIVEPTPADSLTLSANYPNPFNSQTQINFSLPSDGHVRLTVYNVLGRRVAVLVDRPLTSRQYTVRVNAANWASGVYFYVLEFGGRRLSRKMVLVK